MPYYHLKDNGKIGMWSRKCSKCGERWPIMAWFQYPPPSDMTRYIIEGKEKRPVKYAKWADRIPGANVIAGLLPNWPRWARLLTVIVLVLVIISLFIFITGRF